MNTDLIGSVELTASAAIVIAALSIGFGSNATTRLRVAVGLSLWFVLVVVLAATRALYYEHGLGAPGLGIAVTLLIAVLCFVVARTQSLREAFRRVSLWLLIRVHMVRLLGISFIILYAAHRLPAPFAPVAGWGDIFCGRNCFAGGMARVSLARKRSADHLDLEFGRTSRSDGRRWVGSNFLARSAAPDLCRTQLGHHDNFAVALDSRLFGPAAVYGSHRYFHSTGATLADI